jgi:short-chain fatty acids transporter
MRKNWIDRVAQAMERLVPDAITTAILMMVVLFLLSLALGASATTTMDAYYRGLWSLLAFTMQMTLILVLSLILGSTPVFKGLVLSVSRLPRTTAQVVTLAVLSAAFISYLNWGLAIALTPIVAIHFAREAERKGIPVDFLFLLATLAGAGSIWQFGFSGSAPLLVATPGHFLEKTTGIMPLSTTIWAPATLVLVVTFTAATVVVGCLLMPRRVRPLSAFPEVSILGESGKAAAQQGTPAPRGLAQWLEQSPLVMAPLALMLAGWLYHHFSVKRLSLDINSVNTIVLLAGVILHGNVLQFTKALQEAVARSWPIVLMYHLYAGLAGLIQYTPVGDFLINLLNPLLTSYSYTFLTALISAVVAIFIPTSGGQWLIQGLVTVRTAELVGASAQRGLLALSVGDHVGNLVTPFWAVVGASIARIDFRLYFGYRLLFAVLWFVMGVLAFTFLPC